MSKSEMLRARIEPDIKHDAEEILRKLGLSSSQAIGLFYQQVIINRGLPFEVKLPNQETQEAMLDLVMKRNVTKHSLEDFKKKFL